MVEIRPCTVAELEAAPNLAEVLAEYAREASLPELGEPTPQTATYRALEASGMFHPIAAFDENSRLLGFILPIVVTLPHYGVVAATVESFFVSQAERPKGIGLMLLMLAENLAKNLGAKALLLSAPAGGVLDEVLFRTKRYRYSNTVYVTALA